jgi:hypothetical protein
MRIPIEPARWRALACSEAPASYCASAASYGLSKDVFIVPIVEAELKFVQIQRQILLRHVVIRADDSALEQSPETINILSVYFSAHVLASGVSYCVMAKARSTQIAITGRLIGRDQINLVAHCHLNETVERANIHGFDHLTHHITFAANRADNRSLTRRATPDMQTLIGMLVFLFATKKGFIHFDNAHKLLEIRVFHPGPEPMAHIESTLVRSGADHPMDLKSADSLLRREHKIEHLKPRAKGHLGFLKNGPSFEREAVRRAIILAALLALPVPRARRALVHMVILASRAERASGPAMQEQIRPARLLIWKHPIEIRESHLPDEARFVFCVIGHTPDISAKQDGSQLPDNPLFYQARRKWHFRLTARNHGAWQIMLIK